MPDASSLMPLMKGITLKMLQPSPCSDVDPGPCAVALKDLLRKQIHLKLFFVSLALEKNSDMWVKPLMTWQGDMSKFQNAFQNVLSTSVSQADLSFKPSLFHCQALPSYLIHGQTSSFPNQTQVTSSATYLSGRALNQMESTTPSHQRALVLASCTEVHEHMKETITEVLHYLEPNPGLNSVE